MKGLIRLKTRSAVLRKLGASTPYKESQPIQIEELELDAPGRDEVLVKILAASLCHSDLSVVNGSRPRPVPMALGHEAAGIVMSVGEGVTDFAKGDQVICVFVPSCGECVPCQEGRPALCERAAKSNEAGTLLNGGIRLHNGDEKIYHHIGVSAFSDYAVVSKQSLVKVTEDLTAEQLALFGCAVITGVGAVANTAKVPLGSSVAVVGLRGVGLSALLGAIAAGAREVVALDINDQKLVRAAELGATATYRSDEADIIDRILEETNGGFDYVFETAGVVPALEVAYAITKRGGVTTTTGLPDPKATFALPYVTLTASEKTLKGSYVGSAVPRRDIPHYIQLMKAGKLPVDELIAKTIRLEEINEGFDLLASGEYTRILISFE